jgi:hypothetical protein
MTAATEGLVRVPSSVWPARYLLHAAVIEVLRGFNCVRPLPWPLLAERAVIADTAIPPTGGCGRGP